MKEYLMIVIDGPLEIQAKLNEFAPQGWEYVDFIKSADYTEFGWLILVKS